MTKPIIAIDGPAGAGKSTIAKLVAQQLGFIYIDTGAMYRAVTLAYLASAQKFSEEYVGALANKVVISFKADVSCNRVYLNGQEVTQAIRSIEVTNAVSQVAAVPAVRTAMVAAQRQMGELGGVVMDGRDIGTVVFPHAEYKIFLTASADERARRRFKEFTDSGKDISFEQLKQDIERRDKIDSEREVAPLCCATDAHYLDSSSLSIPQVVAKIIDICQVK